MKPKYIALLVTPLALAGCPQTPKPLGEDFTEAKAVFERACSACHQTGMVLEKRKTREGWAETVSLMVGKGAALTPKEAGMVVDYLTAMRGK